MCIRDRSSSLLARTTSSSAYLMTVILPPPIITPSIPSKTFFHPLLTANIKKRRDMQQPCLTALPMHISTVPTVSSSILSQLTHTLTTNSYSQHNSFCPSESPETSLPVDKCTPHRLFLTRFGWCFRRLFSDSSVVFILMENKLFHSVLYIIPYTILP